MKITKFYCEATSIENLSKDKVQITMSWDEYSELRNLIDVARFYISEKQHVGESINRFNVKLKKADFEAKSKWVK